MQISRSDTRTSTPSSSHLPRFRHRLQNSCLADYNPQSISLYVSISLDAAESNRIFSAGAAGPEGEGQGYVVGVEDGPGYEEEEFALLEPNLLVVRVRRAKDLKGLDVNITGDGFTSDPFVKIVCDGVEFR